jgi:hypothetical protein
MVALRTTYFAVERMIVTRGNDERSGHSCQVYNKMHWADERGITVIFNDNYLARHSHRSRLGLSIS